MMCNDLCPIEPADAKETCIYLDAPSKFVGKDDERINSNANKKRKIYYEENDNIKELCKHELLDAFTLMICYIHFQNHKVKVPKTLMEDVEEFKSLDCEEDRFNSIFEYTHNGQDEVSVSDINAQVQMNNIAMTSIKYKHILIRNGCRQSRNNKYRFWCGLKIVGKSE